MLCHHYSTLESLNVLLMLLSFNLTFCIIIYLCVWIFCMCVHHVRGVCWRPEEAVGSTWTRVIDVLRSPHLFDPGPLEEQHYWMWGLPWSLVDLKMSS